MNETDARRLLQSAYPGASPNDLAWRRWLESPAPRRRPRRAMLAAVIAVCVVIAVAVPVGITLALHRQSPLRVHHNRRSSRGPSVRLPKALRLRPSPASSSTARAKRQGHSPSPLRS